MSNPLDEQSHEHSGLLPLQDFHDVELTPLFQVLSRGRGINSEILYHHYSNGEKKVVARYGTLKKHVTLAEAEEMVKDLLCYQQELEKRNVPIPKIEQTHLEYDHTLDKAIVIKVTPWTGRELRHLIQGAHPVKDLKVMEAYIRAMMKIIGRVANERFQNWETVVGIDPRCSNFTLDDQGKMWFVDLFPPRYRKNGIPLVEWPEPVSEMGKKISHFKHFDARGIILCTTAQLARTQPTLKSFFEGIVHEEARKMMKEQEHEQFMKELSSTPWMKLRSLLSSPEQWNKDTLQEAKNIVSFAAEQQVFEVDYSVYTLREIALELAQLKIITNEELKNFFSLSHFEDTLPSAVMELLKNNLKDFLERIIK